MKKLEWKEKVLLSSERAHAELKKAGSRKYYWDSYNSEKQVGALKLQHEIKKFVDRKIGKGRATDLICSIDEVLDTDSKIVVRNLVLKYRVDTDFDIESLVFQLQQVVDNSLKYMMKVSEKSGSDPHTVKIVQSSNMMEHTDQKDRVVLVETDDERELVSALVVEVLAKTRKAENFSVSVNGKHCEIDLKRAANLPVETEDKSIIKGSVIYVDDSTHQVGLREYGGGTSVRKYFFIFEQRDELIKAQLHGYLVLMEYTPSEKFKNGELVEIGGAIDSVTGLENERLI